MEWLAIFITVVAIAFALAFALALKKAEEKVKKAKKREEKLFFEKGLPPLREAGQKSSSSANASVSEAEDRKTKYPSVKVVHGSFVPNPASFTYGITSSIRALYYVEGRAEGLSWGSERCLRFLVQSVIKDAIRAGLLHASLGVLTEITITNLRMLKDFIPNMRGDVWVVSLQDYPIGVVKVKKRHRKYSLGDDKSWRSLYQQIHVYMRYLGDYFGAMPVFGIVTTYEEWRVCWLHDPIAYSGSSTSTVSTGVAEINRFFERTPTMEETNPTKFVYQAGAPARAQIPDNVLYVSDVYRFDNPDLPVVLTTTMKLMASTRVNTSFLTSTLERSFVTSSDKEKSWQSGAHIRPALKPMLECIMSRPFSARCVFYLVADMHGGAHGSVWLARTCEGTLHVLKVPVTPDLGDIGDDTTREDDQRKERVCSRDAEYDAWKRAYPFLCKDGYICARDLTVGPALVMPLFGHVSDARRLDVEVRDVVKEDITRLAQIGLSHQDLSWRHVGLYHDLHGKLCSVLFDLALVQYSPTPISPVEMLSRLGL